MDIEYFEKLWERKKIAKSASQFFWDGRAKEFNQRVDKEDGAERLNKIFDLLSAKGMLSDESNVLDIGCGPGKYAIEFARRVKSVIGVDVAPKMIAYARENASSVNELSHTEFKVADWEEVDLNLLGWNKKFDLVFASMCPAISNKASLEKMVNASKGYCFMSGFVERTDSIKDHLSNNIVRQNTTGGFGKSIYCSFNILWLMGFYPEITYVDAEWEHVMSVDDAADFFCAHFNRVQNATSQEKMLIRNYLEQISDNGLVKEKTRAKIAWLTWKV